MNRTALKSNNSPHLALVLEQLAKTAQLDETAAKKILVTFETALSKRGSIEFGFKRQDGQSFNPRAARIILILLNDAKLFDDNQLITAAERAGEGELYEGFLDLESPIVVSGAFLLDRLRHLHLESNPDSERVYASCIKAKELLSSDFPKLALLLEKGVERMKRSVRQS